MLGSSWRGPVVAVVARCGLHHRVYDATGGDDDTWPPDCCSSRRRWWRATVVSRSHLCRHITTRTTENGHRARLGMRTFPSV
jgi:hypothetical protein